MSGVRLSRAYLPGMLKRNWGRIVFISSESALNIPKEMIITASPRLRNLRVPRSRRDDPRHRRNRQFSAAGTDHVGRRVRAFGGRVRAARQCRTERPGEERRPGEEIAAAEFHAEIIDGSQDVRETTTAHSVRASFWSATVLRRG